MIRNLIFILALAMAASAPGADDEQSIQGLRDALVALSPDVDAEEAEQISVALHTTSRSLAREYRFVRPPDFHNFLIHIGLRRRGYCYDWVRDIAVRLKDLKPTTLALHWGAALVGTSGENNCLVLTEPGQPFAEGIVIDGWRKGGRLWWSPVSKDREYVWHEDTGETAWLQDYRPHERRLKRTAARR